MKQPGEVHASQTAWQPIETVPQDRRWVLVWQEDYECAVCRFGPGLISEPDDVQWTHWMPIPSPPGASQ